MRDYRVEIGRRITYLRNKRGLTQAQLAEILDCSVKNISHSERGLSFMSLDKYLFLSDYFDCSIQYLLTGEDPLNVSLMLPASMVEILQNGYSEERRILLAYLEMYSQIRNHSDQT